MALPESDAWTGGPDGCGYTGIDSDEPNGPIPAFIDITALGTGGTGSAQLWGSETAALPFPFDFCGIPYTQVRLASNGFLCFGGGSCDPYAYVYAIPNSWNPHPAVFGYATDLDPPSAPGCIGAAPGAGTCVMHGTVGLAPNRIFIYQFQEVPLYYWNLISIYNPGATFQIQLHEATGCVEVHYLNSRDTLGTNQVAGGIQHTATAGMEYFSSYPGPTLTAKAVQYCQTVIPPPSCSPATQTAVPGQTVNFIVANGVAPFTWSAPAGTPASGAGSSFSTSYAAVGSQTVTVTDGLGRSAQCTVTVNPPACGYTLQTSIPYNFVDISVSGSTPVPAHTVDSQRDFTIPWTAFYCGSYSNILRTSSNGYVCFGTASACTSYIPHVSLPSTSAPNGAVFGYWTDLNVPGCSTPNCGAKWEVQGTSPNRVFIYSFKDVPFFSNGGAITFQMKLFEATHCWEVHYQDVVPQSTQRTVAGMENMGGTAGMTWKNVPASGFAASLEAWGICPGTPPPPPPPTCAPAMQTIAPGGTATWTGAGGTPHPMGYDWGTAPAGSPATGQGVSFASTFATPGTYTVTLTDAWPQSAVCTVDVPGPSCTPATQTVDPNTSVTLTAVNALGPVSWSAPGGSPNSGTGPSFTTTFSFGYTYTITLTDANGFTGSCKVTVKSPACGMTLKPVPYDFIDIVPTGTRLPHADDGSIDVTPGAGFKFPFCGGDYATIRTGSNGYVCFGTGECKNQVSHASLPNAGAPNNAIYGYWTDVDPFTHCAAPCGAYWEVQGVAPDRVFIYSFHEVPYWTCCGPGAFNSFQIKLFEATGCAETHYRDVVAASQPHSGTIAGMEDPTGASGLTWMASAPPGFAATKQAWGICPFKPFMAMNDAYTFNEDQSTKFFDVMANDINGLGGNVSVLSFTLPSKGSLAHLGSGIFSYTPFADAAGTDSFEYTLSHASGETSKARVTIAINPVNDAPLFTMGNPIVFDPQGGTLDVPGWATGVAPGPAAAADEASQDVWFEVTVDNPSIFAGLPTVERTPSPVSTMASPSHGAFGVLRIHASGVFGESQVCVTAVDSGGNDTVVNSWGVPASGVDRSDAACLMLKANEPPVAYFEAGTEVAAPAQTVSFDACPRPDACSHDVDGTIPSYQWDFGDGHKGEGASAAHGFAAPGAYTVRLTVRDNDGAASQFTRTIMVEWPPSVAQPQESQVAPTADAGLDRTVREGVWVLLAGAQEGASQPVFAWSQASGPPIDLANASSAFPSFVAPVLPADVPVDLVFSLRVWDGNVASAPDYVVVRVVAANTPPIAKAGPPQQVAAGSTVTLDASQSHDADLDDLVFRWEQVAGPMVTLSDAQVVAPMFVAPEERAELRFRLRVTDGRGGASQDEVVITVDAPSGNAVDSRATRFIVVPGADGSYRFEGPGEGAVWEFGDGSTARGDVVTHRFAPGRYVVTMRSDDGPEAATYSQEVVVPASLDEAETGIRASWPLAVVALAFLVVAFLVAFLAVRRQQK